LLSYISRPLSFHNTALNAIIHFPTNILTNDVYNNDTIANIHTL
jgi:hypothetical protein